MIKGKCFIITGATSGIGEATAREAAKRGAKLILAGRRAENGMKLQKELHDDGNANVEFVTCDVSKETDCKALVTRAMERFGHLDGAFNNAGQSGPLTFTEEEGLKDMDEYDQMMNCNVKGVFMCMRHQIPAILKNIRGSHGQRGSIVNNSSITGLKGSAGLPAYSASKHAVCGLSKAIAGRYAKEGVRVNTVCPGFFPSELTDAIYKDSGGLQLAINEQLHAVGRSGALQELANAVLWLLSDESPFVTGIDLPVDGGHGAVIGIPKVNVPTLFEAYEKSKAETAKL
eukprot:gnl/MRDRNA2_/MRDRNA2_80027_c0_seq1.p1 gnl/MRDRNA2_/MRDRNA2_80027_c0~~gnl/MRDRNA2_/MRDRNA2_80027_c0_seq1.p1  ORF type:complete len:287 (-),score=53.63 gnl/MRDRNA2_/MRDRNA2_80027_c0_seq1:149-1009(-)